jgi:pimeloyl-ACP methyl ester carboxylesterase
MHIDMTPAVPANIAHRPLRLVAVTAAVLTIGVAACSDDTTSAASPAPTVASTTTTVLARPTTMVVDELIAIDNGTMHLGCVGSGDRTVLLIAGWGDADDNWDAIEPAIAQRARVCSYARFGTGASDAPSTTQTFTTQAEDLHTLLDTAGEPGPYVVLGHSFGGVEAVTFASMYAEEVSGLVLVDTPPTTWPATVCSVAAYEAGCAAMHDPARDPERLDVFPAFEEAATITSLGDLPMTVITAAHRDGTGLAPGEPERLDTIWDEGVAEWAELSSSSRVVSVEDTGHYVHLDQPHVVIDELTRLIP